MNRFYAMLSRMKYITRWGLMRATRPETLSEHTLETALITHALILMGNARRGLNLDPGKGVLLALYHDAGEIITGDLPTPIKYHSHRLNEAYKEVERMAGERLLRLLPDDLRPSYRALLLPDQDMADYLPYVRAADKLSALIKCTEELSGGNREFSDARQALLESPALELPEAQMFLAECLPAYALSLDELSR
jgi:5'-deoxynucleotidase